MGGHTKLVWLRAIDWAEVRLKPGQPWAPDPDRYQFDIRPEVGQKHGLLEAAVSLDGGGRDTYIIRVGHIADKQGAYAIYAMDSADGKEREVVPRGLLFNPLITPDGLRIVYTAGEQGPRRSAFRGARKHVRIVDWNGSHDREVTAGECLWVWRDPKTGLTWAYVTSGHKSISRVLLDGEAKVEPVVKIDVSNRFSISADGLRAGGEFPWPKAGLLDLTSGEVTNDGFRHGCNSYLSPDNAYRLMVMAGSHATVTMYTPEEKPRDFRVVPPNLKPLSTGKKGVVWNPKWTSNARGFTVNGPVKNLGSDVSDIWLARFSADYSKIEQWVQVTNNKYCDTYAYAWVAPGPTGAVASAKSAPRPPTATAGENHGPIARATIKATLLSKSETPTIQSMAPYTNAFVVYEYRVDRVLDGKCSEKTIRVAQWGVKDLKPTPLVATATGTAATLVIELFSAHPKLESEFLNDTLPEDFEKPLYVQME
jgi:hypothetical protein